MRKNICTHTDRTCPLTLANGGAGPDKEQKRNPSSEIFPLSVGSKYAARVKEPVTNGSGRLGKGKAVLRVSSKFKF